MAFKRELGPRGATWYADNFEQDSEILKYANDIAEVTGLHGSCNIQVRKSSNGVRLLEINPRFSSLVAARSVCGFKDLEWSINLALGRKIVHDNSNYKKIRFQRYLHEMIDFGNGYKCVTEWTPNLLAVK